MHVPQVLVRFKGKSIAPYLINELKKCKGECKASEDRQYCTGCLRTMEEIINAGRNAKKASEDAK